MDPKISSEGTAERKIHLLGPYPYMPRANETINQMLKDIRSCSHEDIASGAAHQCSGHAKAATMAAVASRPHTTPP